MPNLSFKINAWIFWFAIAGLLVSCGTIKTRSNQGEGGQQPLVDEKYSLKSDRETLDRLRKDIPEERKVENDESALMESFFVDLKNEPSEIRDKFSNLHRKKREKFDADLKKEREQFNKNEKQMRDKFMEEAKEEREDFLSGNKSSSEKKKFFDEQEVERKAFLAEQREKRDDFEESTREKRKNFEDYNRSKNNEFNSRLRDFTKKRDEEKKRKKNLEQDHLKVLNQELDEARKRPGVNLEVEE